MRRLGPSPRIRGESKEAIGTGLLPGTIPANTGRILSRWGRTWPPRDHPREYGENLVKMGSDLAATGPSPRIRGESAAALNDTKIAGTIPANTGRMAGLGIAGLADEGPSPRIRGE